MPGTMAHTSNSSALGTEAGGLLEPMWVPTEDHLNLEASQSYKAKLSPKSVG